MPVDDRPRLADASVQSSAVLVGGGAFALAPAQVLRSVLALPINITAGLLGMNVGGIPLAQHPHGLAIIVTTSSKPSSAIDLSSRATLS